MNNCLYLIKDLVKDKYYIGSHKDAANIEDKTYTSSSEDLNAAITKTGIENFKFTVLKTFKHRYTAFRAEKNLLDALNAADDEQSYNNTNTILAKRPNWFTRTFVHPKFANTDEELNRWVEMATSKETAEAKEHSNDFNFESGLGDFLEHGYDAFKAEGEEQGYEDPSEANWAKQVSLLKVQLNNNLERELFIKNNKYSILKKALEEADNIVSSQIEFVMQLKRAENEVTYIKEEAKKIAKEEGWYLMLHEALHDGFQDGAKRKLEELNNKYKLS